MPDRQVKRPVKLDAEFVTRFRKAEVTYREVGALIRMLQQRLLGDRLFSAPFATASGCGARAIARCAAEDAAERAAAEGIERAYEKIATLKTDAAFTTWIYEFARNVACEQRKAEYRHARRRAGGPPAGARSGDPPPPLYEQVPDTRPGPEENLLRTEERERLEAAIRTLPDRQRQVAHLKLIEYRESSEAAGELGIPRTAVNSAFADAVRTIRRKLLDMGDGADAGSVAGNRSQSLH
jgi:RNA polymerase sigma factor (sigma-70 family)